MNGHDRILALLAGQTVDRLPRMPITMMFAADLAGIPYGRYAADYRAMVEAQIRTAEAFDIDHVSGAFPTPPVRRPTAAPTSSSSTISRRRSTRSRPCWPTRPCWRG